MEISTSSAILATMAILPTKTFELKKGDEGSIVINATSKNGLVDSLTYTYTYTEDGTTENQNLTMTFEYGSASVTVPDITGWYNASDEG